MEFFKITFWIASIFALCLLRSATSTLFNLPYPGCPEGQIRNLQGFCTPVFTVNDVPSNSIFDEIFKKMSISDNYDYN